MKIDIEANQNYLIQKRLDAIMKIVLMIVPFFVILLCLAIFVTFCFFSLPSIIKIGFGVFRQPAWNPSGKMFSFLPHLCGTLITALLALLFALPFSFSLMFMYTVYIKRKIVSVFIKKILKMLSLIPSVVFGVWGYVYLVPIMRNLEKNFGKNPADGLGLLTASIILAIMIIPYLTITKIKLFEGFPSSIKDQAFALGAHKTDIVYKVLLPQAFPGILAAIILSFSKVVGEAMITVILLGISNKIPESLFDASSTMATVIIKEFFQAGDIGMNILIELALLLSILTILLHFISAAIVKRYSRRYHIDRKVIKEYFI